MPGIADGPELATVGVARRVTSGAAPTGSGHAGEAIFIMAAVGVAIRLVLAPFTSYTNDDLPWYWMGVSGIQHLSVYARPGFSYPPVWGWLLELVGRVLGSLGATPSALGVHDLALNGANMATGGGLASVVTSPLFNVCVKLLLTASDLVTALLIGGLASALSDRPRAREVAFALYFLNPLVISESSVRAGIDGLIALSVAAALFAAVRNRPYMAGVALSLGVCIKLTPILVAPLVLVATMSSAGPEPIGRAAARQARDVVLGALSVGCPILLTLFATGQWAGFLENTFSRTKTGLAIGGPALGGLRHFGALSGLLADANRHNGAVLDASLAAELTVVVAMTLWTWSRGRRSMPMALTLSCTVTLAVVVLTTPTSQPGYVLWLLPPLAALVASNPRSYGLLFGALSLSALVFSWSYYGPEQVLFPLAEYTGVVSPGQLANSVQHWFLRPTGLWGASYKEDFASVCAAVSIVAYLFLVARCLDERALLPTESAGVRPGDRVPAWQSGERAVVGFALLSGVAMLLSAATPNPAVGSTGTVVDTAAAAVAGHRTALTSRPVADENSLRILSFPLASPVRPRRIAVVVDPHMPLGATTLEDESGVFDNLRAEMELRGYPGSVQLITASTLVRLMADGSSAEGTAVVDTTGVLPTQVLGPRQNLLVPWLQKGGVLYWGGGPIGLWHADAGQAKPVTWSQGPESVLGPAAGERVAILRQGSEPTPIAKDLGIQYQDTSFSPSADTAVGEGAALLGYVDAGRSSLTDFAIGAGRLVLFGGLMYANGEVASDIALLQMSGVPYASGPIGVSSLPLRGRSLRWTTESPGTARPWQRLVVFDPRLSGIAFSGFNFSEQGCPRYCPIPVTP